MYVSKQIVQTSWYTTILVEQFPLPSSEVAQPAQFLGHVWAWNGVRVKRFFKLGDGFEAILTFDNLLNFSASLHSFRMVFERNGRVSVNAGDLDSKDFLVPMEQELIENNYTGFLLLKEG